MSPSVLSLSLHAAEPERVQLDLEELQVLVTADLAEAGALLEFQSKAFSGIDKLSSPYSLGGYIFDLKTILLVFLVVISLSSNLIAFSFLFSLRSRLKKLDSKLAQTCQGLGVTETSSSAT